MMELKPGFESDIGFSAEFRLESGTICRNNINNNYPYDAIGRAHTLYTLPREVHSTMLHSAEDDVMKKIVHYSAYRRSVSRYHYCY